MIGRIVIENYKSIESLSLDLGRVTVLIGANGSGKSNILEAIALCSAAAANKLDNEFLSPRGIRVSDDLRHMFPAFTAQAEHPQIKVSILEKGLAGDNNSFSFAVKSIGYGGYEQLIRESAYGIDYYKIFHKVEQKNPVLSFDEQGSLLTAEYKNIIYQEIQSDFEASTSLKTFLLYAPENTPLRRFEEEGQIQPLGIRGEGLFKLLTVLARPENADRLAEIQERLQLLDWFGEFQVGGNIEMGERNLRIRDQYLDGDLAYFTQRSANEGFLFLLFYFTLFVAKETPRFFAVDNIDASLNPKLCAELLRQLCELAEKYDKQVILTTHNPAILDGLNLRDDNQRLYVVERDLEGRTQARRIEPRGDGESGDGRKVRLSEAFLRGYIGGLPLNF